MGLTTTHLGAGKLTKEQDLALGCSLADPYGKFTGRGTGNQEVTVQFPLVTMGDGRARASIPERPPCPSAGPASWDLPWEACKRTVVDAGSTGELS